jgi:transposase
MRRRSGGIKVDLRRRVRREQISHPGAKVEVWAMDEHRVGLKPILRSTWAPMGERPRAVVYPRYEWLYVVAFVHPESGSTSFWLIPEVSKASFLLVLHAFAAEQGVGEKKRIVLVLDNAGWHVDEEEVPEEVVLDFLPPYSPELQPAERLWTLCDEPLVNRSFSTLEELEEVLGARCVELSNMPGVIRAHTLFHWWPRTRRFEYH